MTQNKTPRRFGLFAGIAALTWFGLIFAGKLTLSPTRQTLFMLPLFAVVTAEGFGYLIEIFCRTKNQKWFMILKSIFPVFFILALAGIFLAHYPVFLTERRDPVVEREIVDTLKKYNVTQLIKDARSFGGHFMKELAAYGAELDARPGDPYETVARITRYPLHFSIAGCEKDRAFLNYKLTLSGSKDLAVHPCSDYHLIYSKEVDTGGHVEFSGKSPTDVLANRFFFYIAQLKEKAST